MWCATFLMSLPAGFYFQTAGKRFKHCSQNIHFSHRKFCESNQSFPNEPQRFQIVTTRLTTLVNSLVFIFNTYREAMIIGATCDELWNFILACIEEQISISVILLKTYFWNAGKQTKLGNLLMNSSVQDYLRFES